MSAQDKGFRFVAYVVSSGDQRIAISDPLALSHHAIGAQIDYWTLETATSMGRLLEREVQLSAAERAALSRPLCGIPSVRETGVIDQALFTDADGYEYRAYVCRMERLPGRH